MIRLSPTSLRAFLACPRAYWLSHVVRAPKHVPDYVMGGRDLDAAAQNWLQDGTEPVGADGPDATVAELAELKRELPAPGTVLVQHRLELPCPGLEGQVLISAIADYVTPPTAGGLTVIGDVKRVYAKEAAYDEAGLAGDVQAQLEAWLVWQLTAPTDIIWHWNYLVRQTTSKATGLVTRKPKAHTVTVKADRARVNAWFDEVVLPAARAMLDISGPVEAIEHDPDSCENGGRCFVRSSCPIHTGPIKQGEQLIMDLNRFKTQQLAAGAARVAINPPALDVMPQRVVDMQMAASRETDTADNVLDAVTIEGPGAELLESVPDTIPAPEKAPRKRKAKAEQDAQRPIADALRLASENEPVALEDASTEAIRDELLDRGWTVTMSRSR